MVREWAKIITNTFPWGIMDIFLYLNVSSGSASNWAIIILHSSAFCSFKQGICLIWTFFFSYWNYKVLTWIHKNRMSWCFTFNYAVAMFVVQKACIDLLFPWLYYAICFDAGQYLAITECFERNSENRFAFFFIVFFLLVFKKA